MNIKVKAALLSILSNTFLILTKITAGLLSNSISVLSEALHSGMDLIASFIAFFSVSLSSKPPDKEHPYGHGKIENISGTIEGILLIIAAGLIILSAGKKIFNPQPLQQTNIAILVMFLSAVINIFVSRYLYKVAKKEDSIALEADALHLKTDIYTSIGVGIGIILIKYTGLVIIDPIIAILVALLIIKEAIMLCSRAFLPLLDSRLPEQEEALIKEILDQYQGPISGYHKLKTRKSGKERYVEFHLEVNPDLSIKDYQEILGKIQEDLKNNFDDITVTIQAESAEPPKPSG